MKPVAYKFRISDLLRGRYVRSADISEPSHLLVPPGVKVTRARIMGTVIEKFLRDDHGYAMLRLDDGTETITVRAWRDGVQELEKFEVGDVVDVVGRIREFEGELYVVPDLIIEVRDPNLELLRELENMKQAIALRASEAVGTALPSREEETEDLLPQVPEELKNKVMLALDRLDSPAGATAAEIGKEVGLSVNQVEEALRALLMLGSIYEPAAGRYRLTR
ncbi:MAG: OB-fold nucleic acid binding domain-containing protein [Candidatus Hadarchaeales archaeon]